MKTLKEVLDKLPKAVKDKFLIKKRERAIEIVKEKIAKSGKNIKDIEKDENNFKKYQFLLKLFDKAE